MIVVDACGIATGSTGLLPLFESKSVAGMQQSSSQMNISPAQLVVGGPLYVLTWLVVDVSHARATAGRATNLLCAKLSKSGARCPTLHVVHMLLLDIHALTLFLIHADWC